MGSTIDVLLKADRVDDCVMSIPR